MQITKKHYIFAFFCFSQVGDLAAIFRLSLHKKNNNQILRSTSKNELAEKTLQPPSQKGIIDTRLIFSQKHLSLSLSANQYRSFVKERIKNSNFLNFDELKKLQIQPKEISIGIVGAMSGVNGFYMQETIDGILAKFEAVNKKGGIAGHRLRLIVVNDYQNPTLTRKIVEYLKNQHNVSIFLGNFADDNLFAIYSLIKDKKITVLFPNVKNREFLSPYNKNIINGSNNYELLLDRILDFVVHHLRAKERVAVFYPDDELGRHFAAYIKNKFDIMRIKPPRLMACDQQNPAIIKISQDLIDFRPEAVISLCNYIQTSRVCNYFLQKKFKSTFVGNQEIFFAAKILEDFLVDPESNVGLLKIFYASFVPEPSLGEFKIVREYLNDLQHLKESLHEKTFSPSPISLTYYINACIAVKAISQALAKNKKFILSDDLQTHIINRIENLKDLDIGGFLVGFNATNRCAYYLEPTMLATMKSNFGS